MPRKTEPEAPAPREIEWAGRFTRDYRRESKGQHRATLDHDLGMVLDALVSRQPLDHLYKDHPMKGEWRDYRDCHVRPDLVLIYRISESDVVQLARLGSHAELFGS